MWNELGNNVKIINCTTAAVASSTSHVSGRIIDMAGFEGVGFYGKFGAIAATAVPYLQVQMGSSASLGDAVQVESGTITFSTLTSYGSGSIWVHKPRERYLRMRAVKATAAAAVECIVAVQYGARKSAVADSTASKQQTKVTLVSPTSG